MDADFNPWREWLGVTQELDAVDCYALLGLPRYETDPVRIRRAGVLLLTRVRSVRPGEHAVLWSAVLDSLKSIQAVLTDPHRKAQYDAQLRSCPEAASVGHFWRPALAKAAAGDHPARSSRTREGTDPAGAIDTAAVPADEKPFDADPAMAPFVPDFAPVAIEPDPMAPAPWVTRGQAASATPPAGIAGSDQAMPAGGQYTAHPTGHGSIVQGAVPATPEATHPVVWSSPSHVVAPPATGPASSAVPSETKAVAGPASGSLLMARKSTSLRTSVDSTFGPTIAVFVAGVITGALLTYVGLGFVNRAGRVNVPPVAQAPSEQMVNQTAGGTSLSNAKARHRGAADAVINRQRPPGSQVPNQGPPAGDGLTAALPGQTKVTGTPPHQEPSHPAEIPMSPTTVPVSDNATGKVEPTPFSPAGSSLGADAKLVLEMPPVQPPATALPKPLTPEERKALAEALSAARQAFVRLDFQEGHKWLTDAEPLVRAPEHRAMADRLALLATYLQEYQQAINRALQKLGAGDSISITETTVIGIVERKSTELTVRVAGRNVTYPLNELPLRLGLALVDQGMEAGPKLLAVKAAFQATHPRATPELKDEARQWWLKASQEGEPTAELGMLLDDDYAAIAQQ